MSEIKDHRIKSFKKKFEEIHNEISELQWKYAMRHYGKRAVAINEEKIMIEKLDNKFDKLKFLLDNIEKYNVEYNKMQLEEQRNKNS